MNEAEATAIGKVISHWWEWEAPAAFETTLAAKITAELLAANRRGQEEMRERAAKEIARQGNMLASLVGEEEMPPLCKDLMRAIRSLEVKQ